LEIGKLRVQTGATSFRGMVTIRSQQGNAAHTVWWVNQQDPFYYGTNYTESYGGEWKSPPLNLGDSFSFTFTNAGFYAYRTGTMGGYNNLQPGTVTVQAWTDAPPAVTINTPVSGAILSDIGPGLIQASVTNVEGVAEMQFFANSTLIGTATNAPYAILWRSGPPQGQYVLLAKATDRQGGVTCGQRQLFLSSATIIICQWFRGKFFISSSALQG
jgi:Bacterial Ig domain